MNDLRAPAPAPKAFLSHASADKERFVMRFALELRRRGLDVWLDRWEMLPGDSLVDKIFEEGIRNAVAVIVVISANSINKPWVREELNAAFVKRVNDGSLLLPVVLDDVEVPEALRSTVWERVPDLSDIAGTVDRVVSAVFRDQHRPPIGEPPKYTAPELPSIYGLADTDVVTLRGFGAHAVETGDWIVVDTETIWEKVEALDISRGDFLDALEILSGRHWLEPGRTLGVPPPYFKVTVAGLEEYLTRFEPTYPELFAKVVAEVVNAGGNEIENSQIVDRLKAPKILVDHVLRRLKAKGHAEIYEALGGHISVGRVHPSLRRSIR